MKASHYVTPRQLGDCAFVPSSDPIERHIRGEPRGFLAAVVCIGIVGLLIAWVTR